MQGVRLEADGSYSPWLIRDEPAIKGAAAQSSGPLAVARSDQLELCRLNARDYKIAELLSARFANR